MYMIFITADKQFQKFEDVTPELLKKEHVKLLLCDLDNTLRLHSEKEPNPSLVKWVKSLKPTGVQIVVVSNNGRKKFMQKFCAPLDIPCVWWAKKPLPYKVAATIKKYRVSPKNTVLLGDKWSTDVLAAHFAHIRAWKVNHRRELKNLTPLSKSSR